MALSTTCLSRAETVIDLAAIAHNTRLIAEASGTAVMAVVKADAFGHGMVPVARTVLANGATWLGVTTSAEAAELRNAGINAPILSWMHLPDEDFTHAIRNRVDLGVSTVEHLDAIAALDASAYVHLKADTGLARNGATADEWRDLVRVARKYEAQGMIQVRGIWSHLHSAEDPATVPEQISRFQEALAVAGPVGLRHLANSVAALTVPESRFDMVRAGIGIYGAEARQFGLRPAMSLRARAIHVKRVPAGTGVSYRHDYVTRQDTTLLLVPLGFADGVPRLAGNRGEVWFRGARYPIAGRIAMDQFVVDISDTPASIGDEVVLFGPGDDGEPTVQDWADWALTNPHEILTGIGPRVPRRYTKELCFD